MFITLTNATPSNKGQLITLNTQMIVSIWRGEMTRTLPGSENVTYQEPTTFVFVPPHGTWEVEETDQQIVEMLKKGNCAM